MRRGPLVREVAAWVVLGPRMAPEMFPAGRPLAWAATAGVAFCAVATLGNAWALIRPGTVTIRHNGVDVRGVVGRGRLVLWRDLRRDPGALHDAGLRDIPWYGVVAGRRRGLVPLRGLDVHPGRIFEMVAFYRGHHEHRAGIAFVGYRTDGRRDRRAAPRSAPPPPPPTVATSV